MSKSDIERFEREDIELKQRRRLGGNVREFMEEDAFSLNKNISREDYQTINRNIDETECDLSDKEKEKRKRAIRLRFVRGRKIHRDILVATYFFVALFLSIIGYLVYFQVSKSDEYIQSEYNAKRQSVYANKYIRGNILSADGKVLARTVSDKEGKEHRLYPYNNTYAHSVGYTGKGNTGVESIANSYLLSSHINPIYQARLELENKKIPADNVITTLNNKIQQTAYKSLGDKKGAVIAMEVKTGKILAMVSKPDYDPNKITEIWDELVSDESNSNLVNRATQGLYPPGSTFKTVMALEYYREYGEGTKKFSYKCDSTYEFMDDGKEHIINCSKKTSHGKVDLNKAYAKSCNGAFAEIGQLLDIKKLRATCEELGYNSKIDTQILSSKSKFSLTSEEATTWRVVQTSIGQDTTLTTPLLNLAITAAVANDGTIMTPYIIDRVETANGSILKTFSPKKFKKVMSQSEADFLGKLMRGVITNGTGGDAEGDSYSVAGKTGSAEWKKGEDTHAWFVGFAPYENPEIAVCVIAENSGSGGGVAAPIAKKVFDAYFK